jgi:hypothetical protein
MNETLKSPKSIHEKELTNSIKNLSPKNEKRKFASGIMQMKVGIYRAFISYSSNSDIFTGQSSLLPTLI